MTNSDYTSHCGPKAVPLQGHFAPTIASQYLTAREVAAMLRITERTLREWVRLQKFPAPTVFSFKTKRWSRESIQLAFIGR